jgi:hypothetical protein
MLNVSSPLRGEMFTARPYLMARLRRSRTLCCAPTERGNKSSLESYKHLAPTEPSSNRVGGGRLCPPHLRPSFPYRYRTLKRFAFSSSLHASYAISVRRASVLPAASFRFHLAMDSLAVRLTIPPVGFVGDFHSLVSAPCRAHKNKSASATWKPRSHLLLSTWDRTRS